MIGQNRSTNQRSGMILEVQFQNFDGHAHRARLRTRFKVFIFLKFQGAQISIFFCENQPEASFYNKEQTQNTNLKFDILKVPFWTPEKVHFWFLKKTPKKNFLCVLSLIQL